MAEAAETLSNFVDGRWIPATATTFVDVHNPARGTVIARAPLSTARDVDLAVTAATNAFAGWSETPPVVRARAMFRFKALLEEHFEELARLVTTSTARRWTSRAAASAAASSASKWPAAGRRC